MDNILKDQKSHNFDGILGTDTQGNLDSKSIRSLELGEFASREQTEFYNSAYGDLLFDYFIAWVKTGYEDKNKREFIYTSAQALGDMRNKLANYSTLRSNIQYVNKEKDEE